MTIDLNTAAVTRFDIVPTDDEDIIRLFHKRNLLGRISCDDVMIGDDWEDRLNTMIGAGEFNYAEVEEFLTTEADDEIEGEGDDEEDLDEAPGSIVPEKYRVIYGAAQNCGDDIAIALTEFVTLERANKNNPDGGLDRAKLRGVAEANGIGDRLAAWEDRGLNGGLLRMNTSNVLRGMNRRGEEVQIGSQVWAADPSKLEARKEARKAAKKARNGK